MSTEKVPLVTVQNLLEHPFWRDKKVTKAYERIDYVDGREVRTLQFQFTKKEP